MEERGYNPRQRSFPVLVSDQSSLSISTIPTADSSVSSGQSQTPTFILYICKLLRLLPFACLTCFILIQGFSWLGAQWCVGGAIITPTIRGLRGSYLRGGGRYFTFSPVCHIRHGFAGDLPFALGSLARYFFSLLSGMAAKFLAPKN